jgi:RNA polymerase sigma-70 factor (ECF subfamily)
MVFALAQRPAVPMRSPPVARAAGGASALAVAVIASVNLLGRLRPRAKSTAAAAGSTFEEIVLVHLDAAYSLARYLARDGDAAEDIVQTAVLEAHRGFAGYRGGDAKAWLLTIVRREFMQWSRQRRASQAAIEGVDLSEMADRVPAETPTPEQALLQQGDIEAVRGAIDALPEPFREAIVLRELEELSYREVAQITGVPIGTVMSRLARGRELLARRLRGEASPLSEAAS